MTSVIGVYTHAKPDGTVFWVGKGTLRRAKYMRRNQWHDRIVAKYGADNIIITFTPCASEAEAFRREIDLIADFRRRGVKLANITDGGEGNSGLVHSDETKQKIRAFMKKRVFTKKHRERISRSVKGRKFSPETLQKMRLAKLGKKQTPEAIENHRRVMIGKKQTLAARAATKAALNRPEVKAKKSAVHKRLWADPEYKAMQRKARLESWARRKALMAPSPPAAAH